MLEINILVHSCIYYRMSDNIISDSQFDNLCKRLVELKSSKEFENSTYREEFIDFDGTTGYNLPIGNAEVVSKATYLVNKYGGKECK